MEAQADEVWKCILHDNMQDSKIIDFKGSYWKLFTLKKFTFYFIHAKQIKYCNWSRGKRDFKGLSGRLRSPWSQPKSQIVVYNQVQFLGLTVLPKITCAPIQSPKYAIFSFNPWA